MEVGHKRLALDRIGARSGSVLDTTEALTLPTHEPGPCSNVASAVVSTFPAFAGDALFGVVTVTSTLPEPGGATAVIELSLVTVNERASDAPT